MISTGSRWARGFALGLVAAAAVSCGSSEVGKRSSLDEDAINKVLRDVGFTVPEGFAFGQAYQYSEFVGEPARSARFDGPPELGDGRAVAAANPTYPMMRPEQCDSETTGGQAALGYICAPGTLTTQYPPTGGLDTVTVFLNHDKRGSHLFIYSSGH